MANFAKQLLEIENRLTILRRYQQGMEAEISHLEKRLQELKLQVNVAEPTPEADEVIKAPDAMTTVSEIIPTPAQQPPIPKQNTKSNLENFIGTNVISKIGILITIIGVFIGARYAIDRDLISPVTRIIISYVFAALLAVVGIRLKEKYNAFSAVLIGGSIAIVYFSTYIAYDYYKMFPISVAFACMFITTLLAIALALWYNQKIIALIGQVAAYAIPILLSTGSGEVAVLFTYISIINAGLMVLSFRKNWKIIYRVAFSITWSVYATWIISGNQTKLSWSWSLIFVSICFITFYITYLSYKVFKKELYNVTEVGILLLNAVIFYWLGYLLIDRQFAGTNALTIFTLANAVVHFITGYIIHRLKLADESVRLFLFGQAIAFITISIPVKLDGSWVTMLWSVEAAILIYVAARSSRKLYFQLCGMMMLITLLSLAEDWLVAYHINRSETLAFFNSTFVTSLVAAGSFLYAAIIGRKGALNFAEHSWWRLSFSSLVPITFLVLLYWGIFFDVGLYFDKLNVTNDLVSARHWLSVAMLHLYTMLFLSAAAGINYKVVRSEQIFKLLLVTSIVAVFMQLMFGSWALSNLRGTPYEWVRYLSIAGLAMLFYCQWLSMKVFPIDNVVKIVFSLMLHLTLLTLISNEYIHIIKRTGSSGEYKLGLSIVFAAYALVMLFRGLMKDKSHLRIAAIILFGAAILKLFAYDLSAMSTIGKTIVLIILGVILLAASFLYNKFLKKEI